MASKFTWIPGFYAAPTWLIDVEPRQPVLVNILKSIGIDAGLDDKGESRNAVSLEAIDLPQ